MGVGISIYRAQKIQEKRHVNPIQRRTPFVLPEDVCGKFYKLKVPDGVSGNMDRKIIYVLLLAAVLMLCSTFVIKVSHSDSEYVPKEGDNITPTDYSNRNNWMTVTDAPTKPADVFVLYPTTYSPGEGDPVVAPIDDEGMRAGAKRFMANDASAFETAGNMFAPFYRQLDAAWTLNFPPEERDQYTNGVPKTDVTAAFDHYIKNFNEGRPFILVGHSQGATMVKALLFDYLEKDPEVYSRLIAAYVIGYSVTQSELDAYDHLKFATGEADTGVIISYNTVSPNFTGNLATWLPGSIAINPINWKLDDTNAPIGDNPRSFVNGVIVNDLADAEIDVSRGLLICNTADPATYGMPEPAWGVFPQDSFHGQDIPFYYFSLRQNADVRVAAFLATP